MSNPTPLRIAVVGCGFGARIHVPGLRASGRFEVVALVGRDLARTRVQAAEAGIPIALDRLDDALEIDALDAVSVATPPAHHARQSIAALRAGKHVLCEKPLARSLEEARAMQAAADEAGSVALVDHEFRFHPARAMLERIVRRGDLGVPRLLACLDVSPLYAAPYRPPPAWWFDAAAGGGWLGASGSHLIDGMRTWLGEPICLTAELSHPDDAQKTADGLPAPADEGFAILARFPSGARAALQQSAAVLGPRAQLFRLAGTEGTAWLDERWTLWRAGRSAAPEPVAVAPDLALPAIEVPPSAGPFAATELPAFVRQAIAFADSIDAVRGASAVSDLATGLGAQRATVPPRPATFDDGVRVQRIIDAARRAARERVWVDLDPESDPATAGRPVAIAAPR